MLNPHIIQCVLLPTTFRHQFVLRHSRCSSVHFPVSYGILKLAEISLSVFENCGATIALHPLCIRSTCLVVENPDPVISMVKLLPSLPEVGEMELMFDFSVVAAGTEVESVSEKMSNPSIVSIFQFFIV